MNRRRFKGLARIRLREAQVLLDRGEFAGAYYLCGYVVECGLKACIAKKTRRHDFPVRDSNKLYTHRLNDLLTLAELTDSFESSMGMDPELGKNWQIVVKWREESRYEIRSEEEARELLWAVSDTQHGVFAWIRWHC